MAITEKKRFSLIIAFTLYCLVVLCFVFVVAPFCGMRTVSDLTADANLREFANFIPFKTISEYILSLTDHTVQIETALVNTLGNVLIAIPLGVLLPSLFGRMRWMSATVITTLAITFVLEFFQLFCKLGSFDIDCILLRGIGAAIGYLIYHKLNK